MSTSRNVALAGLLALESCVTNDQYIEIAGLKLKREEDFLQESLNAYPVSSSDLLHVLSTRAQEHEFLVAYLPQEEVIINLSIERRRDGARPDANTLRSLFSSGEKFFFIHNHNNRGIVESENIPLYWLAPSVTDIDTYVELGTRGMNVTYGIISQYGLLTMDTDHGLFDMIGNPYFSHIVRDEFINIQQSLTHVNPDNLSTWAKEYRGIFSLSFIPVDE